MKRPGKNFTIFMVIVCIMALTASVFAGCSAQKQNTGPVNATAASAAPVTPVKKEPTKVTFMTNSFNTDLPKPDSPVIKAIEEYCNVKLDIQWTPNSSYTDKFNITLASGNLPNVIMVPNKTPSYLNAVRAGAFWELGPYFKDYPILSQQNAIVLNNVSVDGKIYALYRQRPLGRNGIIYRKDWLENVGLKEPKTVDDFHNMLKAFATKDPDKNGKDDTYGMVITKWKGPFDIMQIWFGCPNVFGEGADKKLQYYALTNEYIDALKFFKKLYDEKLINQDFAVMDSAKWNEPVLNNKAGVAIDVADRANQWAQGFDKLKDPDFDKRASVMGAVEGPKGLKNLPTTGYNYFYCIPKQSNKTESDLKNILAFIDKLNDKTGQDLATNGLENRHYKLVNGYAEAIKDLAPSVLAEKTDLNQIVTYAPTNLYYPAPLTETQKKVNEVLESNLKIVVPNPAEPLTSGTYVTKGPQLDQIIDDARVKFIVGQIDEAGLKAALDLWKKSGGDDYIKEINDEYAKIKK